MRGALVSVATGFGLPLLYSQGPAETAEMILDIARQDRKRFESGYGRPGYRPRGWKARALFVLKGLPAVGPKRAAALLGAFGSAEAALIAPADLLVEVPGVGPAVAARIRGTLGPDPDKTWEEGGAGGDEPRRRRRH